MKDNIKGGALTEVSFYILLSLYEARYGNEMKQFIQESTEGRLKLGAGTLYGAINTMLKKGWIEKSKESISDDERKKTFIITQAGKEVVERDLRRMKKLVEIATKIVKGEYT